MSAVAVARHRPVDNPFASHRIEGLAYRNRGLEVGDLERRIHNLGGRVAIVGPKGTGKTTLLEELTTLLPGEPVLVRIPGSSSQPWLRAREQLPNPVRAYHVVMVDGAEQLGPFAWRFLLRAARPARCLIATSHRPGRLPTLVECRTDHALLYDLVTELTPEDVQTLKPGLTELFQRHDGNIRSCLRELYDVYAGRVPTSS